MRAEFFFLMGLSAVVLSARFAFCETVNNDIGWTLSVDAARGDYQIAAKSPDWTVGGSVGQAFTDVAVADAQDHIGPYREIHFHWNQEGRRTGSIRLYQSRPLVLFTVTFDDAVDHSPAPFPVLTKLPDKLMEFRYGETDHLRPEMFHLQGKPDEQYGGPFALFDADANTMILSPASDFMIAMLDGDQSHGLRSGLNRTLQSVPAGYTYQTLLAIDKGINRTWDAWGRGLTDLYSKACPANDADAGLKYLGYWTDNGAFYYYNYDLDQGYANTLLAVKAHLDQVGVPIHYLQLDSWWYPKTFNSLQSKSSNKPRAKDPRLPAGTWNRYGGLLEYIPSPDLFPQGLSEFRNKLGIPFITHNRWIDAESPYHATYKISGYAGVDPKWWEKIISDIAGWGAITYEQDWNNYIYNKSPELYSTTWAGEAYMDGMANACAAHNVTMQYCMVMPRFVLQGGAKYPNLTTVRVSGDRLDRGKWREFLYGSRLASALGVWPWTDVFRSSETPNILIAVLSGGMVGISDKIGEEDLTNIFRCIRKDGVIVKPDVPMTPIDSTYIDEASARTKPLIFQTHTTHDEAGAAGTVNYVFSFADKSVKSTDGAQDISIALKSLGITGSVFAYDYFSATGQLLSADQALSRPLGQDGWNYTILAPLGSSGMALIGDPTLFITRGKQRIAAIHDDTQQLQATLLFAPAERQVDLAIYAPSKPTVQVKNGSCPEINYDPATRLARARIVVDAGAPSITNNGDRVTSIEVVFRLAKD